MRVGAAFSIALDPTRPPLFSDVSDMDLLPEEVWHPSAVPPKQTRSEVRTLAHGCATIFMTSLVDDVARKAPLPITHVAAAAKKVVGLPSAAVRQWTRCLPCQYEQYAKCRIERGP